MSEEPKRDRPSEARSAVEARLGAMTDDGWTKWQSDQAREKELVRKAMQQRDADSVCTRETSCEGCGGEDAKCRRDECHTCCYCSRRLAPLTGAELAAKHGFKPHGLTPAQALAGSRPSDSSPEDFDRAMARGVAERAAATARRAPSPRTPEATPDESDEPEIVARAMAAGSRLTARAHGNAAPSHEVWPSIADDVDALADALVELGKLMRHRPDNPIVPMPAWGPDYKDTPIAEDEEIHNAFPTRSNRHDLYAEAMRLVGAKHSKGALVALVNMLLHRAASWTETARTTGDAYESGWNAAIEECAIAAGRWRAVKGSASALAAELRLKKGRSCPETMPDELAVLRERMAKGRAKYANGCTVLSLLDEAGEVAHAVNKYEPAERIREELLDVASVAMRLYFGEIDRGLEIDGLVQRRTDVVPEKGTDR